MRILQHAVNAFSMRVAYLPAPNLNLSFTIVSSILPSRLQKQRNEFSWPNSKRHSRFLQTVDRLFFYFSRCIYTMCLKGSSCYVLCYGIPAFVLKIQHLLSFWDRPQSQSLEWLQLLPKETCRLLFVLARNWLFVTLLREVAPAAYFLLNLRKTGQLYSSKYLQSYTILRMIYVFKHYNSRTNGSATA